LRFVIKLIWNFQAIWSLDLLYVAVVKLRVFLAAVTVTPSVILLLFQTVLTPQPLFEIMENVGFLSAFHGDLLHIPELCGASRFILTQSAFRFIIFVLILFFNGNVI
jgi:hypothetical protein